MLKSLILRRLDGLERKLGSSVDYLRYMVRVSTRGFFRFSKIDSMAERHFLPSDAYYVARIVASRDAGCGSCVEGEVSSARAEGVNADVLAATVSRNVVDLPERLVDVYLFTESVLRMTGDEEHLREKLRTWYREEGVVELALAIAASRVFPVVKRTLGFARSCRFVPRGVAFGWQPPAHVRDKRQC